MFKTGTLQQIPAKCLIGFQVDIKENFSTSADFHGKNCCFHRPRLQEKHRQLCMTVMQNRGSQLIWGGVEKADELLKNYGVVGGLDGISFAGTEKSGTDMTIQVSYKVRLLFYIEMFHFRRI